MPVQVEAVGPAPAVTEAPPLVRTFANSEYVTQTDMNQIRDLQAWLRDDFPLFELLSPQVQLIRPDRLEAIKFGDVFASVAVNQGGFAAQTRGDGITVPVTGYYKVSGNVLVDQTTSTAVHIEALIYVNESPTPVRVITHEDNANTGTTLIPNFDGVIRFNAGDHIDLYCRHNDAADLAFRPCLFMRWINS